MNTIHVIGLSHAYMLKSAYTYFTEDNSRVFQFPLVGPKEIPEVFNKEGTGFSLPDSILKVLNNMESDDYLAISIFNNEHNEVGLFFTGERFYVPSSSLTIKKGKGEFIPASMISAHFIERLEPLRLFIQLLKPYVLNNRILVLDGVQPIGDTEYIKSFLRDKDLSDLNVLDREVHKQLFSWQNKTINDICLSEDVIYIGCPENAVDDKGFMLEIYWQNASHANHHYGELVLNKICTEIECSEGKIENV